jgi:flavin reductase (DIM6/NTAB) family NADH-FMN oxidoreductase RutF
MSRISIPIEDLTIQPYAAWEPGWFLLTSGDYNEKCFNSMTVSWGGMGCMWGRPFVHVIVRPHRYTFQFMETYPTFTLCAFSRKYRGALNLLGTKSGRDGDKITASGLTAEASSVVTAPSFLQAELAIECRKIYWQDMDPTGFLDPELEKLYPKQDYHRIYYGEILAVSGEESYLRKK